VAHHVRRRRSRKWQLIPIAVFASLLVGGAAVAASGTGAIDFTVASPVTVQALGIDIANPAPGQKVSAGAKIWPRATPSSRRP